jgi:hypothetical protein
VRCAGPELITHTIRNSLFGRTFPNIDDGYTVAGCGVGAELLKPPYPFDFAMRSRLKQSSVEGRSSVDTYTCKRHSQDNISYLHTTLRVTLDLT